MTMFRRVGDEGMGLGVIMVRGAEGLFLTWIIGAKSQNDVPVRIQDKRVPPHRDSGEIGLRDIGVLKRAGLFLGAVDRLEMVSVQVERVTARVEVVDDDLDDLALFEDEGVRVGPVDAWVRGEGAG